MLESDTAKGVMKSTGKSSKKRCRLRCGAKKIREAMMKWFAKESYGTTEKLLISWRVPRRPLTDKIFIGRYGECFYVVRDCKDIVDTVAEFESCWYGADV